MLHYGQAGDPSRGVEVVATYGELDLEYSALRKHCVLIDQPQRSVIEVTGNDRLEFLNRMLTQELKGLAVNHVRRSFWLNRKGRIDADLRVINLPGRVLLDVDIEAAERTLRGLSAFVITEDVSMQSLGEAMHRFALHGPSSGELLEAIGQAPPNGTTASALPVDRACELTLAGTQVVVVRDDSAGEPGFEIIVPTADALRIYQQLVESGHDADHGPMEPREAAARSTLGARVRLRPAGWHAYNIARIEAGTPLYNIDFGEKSLPAETGVLTDRVSFTKGCYLGQEIVARMHSRGHSKQVLTALKFESAGHDAFGLPAVPHAGTPLYPANNSPPPGEPSGTNEPPADALGGISSSTLSPMLGSIPIAFAQVKQSAIAPGTALTAATEAGVVRGIVQPSLTFWQRAVPA